jgi:hypothetical protein
MVQPSRPIRVAPAIHTAIAVPKLVRKKFTSTRAARETVCSRFGLDAIAGRYEQLLSGLSGLSGAARARPC